MTVLSRRALLAGIGACARAHGIFADRPAETIGLLRGWMARHDSPATAA